MVVPVFNVLAVICLEVFRGGKPNPVKILKGIATNPLIIASVLGILFLLFGIKIPGFAEGVGARHIARRNAACTYWRWAGRLPLSL